MADTTDYLAKSGDYLAMAPYWKKVGAIMGGAEAVKKIPEYLPRFPEETDASYDYRRLNGKFTNIFGDIVENLASKPFSKEVRLADDSVSQPIKDFVENVDGQGNHLHAFATQYFFHAINSAVDWLLVDYTRMPEGATLADEKRSGARPFWVRVPATDMLAVYSAFVGGEEEFIYARMNESYTRRKDGSTDEELVCRVRILIRDEIRDDAGQAIGYGPARYEVHEKASEAGGVWTEVDAGPITIGVIPLVPLVTGRRDGSSWRVRPPLRDVADLQIEHYQADSDLKMAKTIGSYPMLAGNGISPPMGEDGKAAPVRRGPNAVLYAPMDGSGNHGEWAILEPTTATLKFNAEDLDRIERQMREMGRIPLTAGTAGMTQVTAMLQSQKVSSAVQAWAFLLKDALENALSYTVMWLATNDEPTVFVNTRIAIDLGDGNAPEILRQMREDGDLSQVTYWEEMRDRGVLSQEFDVDREIARLTDEVPGDPTDRDIQDALPPGREAPSNEQPAPEDDLEPA